MKRILIFSLVILSFIRPAYFMEHDNDMSQLEQSFGKLSFIEPQEAILLNLPNELTFKIIALSFNSHCPQCLCVSNYNLQQVCTYFRKVIEMDFPLNPLKINFIETLSKFDLRINDHCLLRGGNTLLHRAVKKKSPALCFSLLNMGANTLERDNFGVTPLDEAPLKSRIRRVLKASIDQSIIKSMKKKNIKPLFPQHELFKAIKNGNLEQAKEILKKIEDATSLVDTFNKESALHFLARAPYIREKTESLCEEVRKKNVSIEALNNQGLTPLFLAVVFNNIPVAKKLIELGADKEFVPKGITLLFAACSKNYPEMVQLLLTHNSSINTRSKKNEETPIFAACLKGFYKVAKILLEHKADLKIRTKDGKTPLLAACEKGHLDIVKLLVQYGANIHETMQGNITGLHLACFNGHLNIVTYLLENNASIDAPTSDGLTPLIYACTKRKNNTIVKKLLQYQANPLLKTSSGKTALDIAREKNKHEIVSILQKNL